MLLTACITVVYSAVAAYWSLLRLIVAVREVQKHRVSTLSVVIIALLFMASILRFLYPFLPEAYYGFDWVELRESPWPLIESLWHHFRPP